MAAPSRIIVTGAAQGLGRAVALRLAAQGVRLAVWDTQAAGVEETAKLCAGRGAETRFAMVDVGAESQVEAAVAEFVRTWGAPDAVVANAGIWEGAPVEHMSDDVWDRVIDCNLRGTWTVTRAAVPAFKSNGSGSIVIVSSTAGQRGEAGYSNYAASKGGQISFAKSLATELAPNIRVNVVAPGWVDTELNHVVFTAEENEEKRKAIDAIPLKRLATAEDVANAIVFLGSDWARHITGEVLNINGGAVLCG